MRKSLMRMTLRQLQIFNEVCDLRSYSRAAEEMSLTQPAVSLQIRQLEELIGQPLFDYVGKKLYLTEAAEALLPIEAELDGDAALHAVFAREDRASADAVEVGRGSRRSERAAPVVVRD